MLFVRLSDYFTLPFYLSFSFSFLFPVCSTSKSIEERHRLRRMRRAFTQVVRDSQFSALGLVLVAELARVWKCIGGEERVSQMPRESAAVGVEDGAMDVEERAGDDVGEVVERVPEPEVSSADVSAGNMGATLKTEGVESLVSGSSGPAAKSTITRSKSKSPPRTMKAQKRKSGKVKKRSSVIDDLFRGLD